MSHRLAKVLSIREKLNIGKTTIGSWMQLPSTSVAEIMGDAGYDWVAVDLEHGSMSTSQLPDLFRALELGGTLPLVRLAHGNLKEAKDALDAGAGGVIIPMVESPEQLKNVIDHSCWPPTGIRGVGFSRANLYGKYFDDYKKEAQQPLIIAQVEHIKAVNDIDSILQVPGLDAIIIGPYDLSASMGLTAQFEHTDFIAAHNKILTSCKNRGKAAGVHIVDPIPAELEKRIREGYQFIAYSIDSVFLSRSVNNPVK
jgi:2-dehydro-3-deoxyglucarate aldolase